MKTGIVKFFNTAKGFGFITDDASGEDIFVHATGLVHKVKDGNKVSFDTKDGKKGITACNVKLNE